MSAKEIFDETVTQYLYVKKISNTYNVSFSAVDEIANDEKTIQSFIDLKVDM